MHFLQDKMFKYVHSVKDVVQSFTLLPPSAKRYLLHQWCLDTRLMTALNSFSPQMTSLDHFHTPSCMLLVVHRYPDSTNTPNRPPTVCHRHLFVRTHPPDCNASARLLLSWIDIHVTNSVLIVMSPCEIKTGPRPLAASVSCISAGPSCNFSDFLSWKLSLWIRQNNCQQCHPTAVLLFLTLSFLWA